MKKKLLYALVLSSVIGINESKAQFFIRDYNITTSGVSQDKPVDVNYETSMDTYFSEHYSRRGNIAVLKYDGTTCANLGGSNITRASVFYDPQAIAHLGRNTAALANVTSTPGNLSYDITMYDHTTSTWIWGNNYAYSNTTDFAILTKDMVLDETNKLLYVVGDITDLQTGRIGIYVAQIDFTTGLLNWHHMYMNSDFDLYSNNIFFNSTKDIYVGGGAVNINDPSDHAAYALDINSTAAVVASAIIRFPSDACRQNVLTKATVKRFKDDVYIFCPSYIGAPDEHVQGAYFLAKTDPSLSVLGPRTIYKPSSFYFYNDVAPKFEFVSNNTQIMVSGISSSTISAIPGYVHSLYDMPLTNWLNAYVYPSTNVDLYGNPIIDCYNNSHNLDQVFTVAEDFGNAPFWYGMRSKSNGYISDNCNQEFEQDPTDCELELRPLDVDNSELHSLVKRIPSKVTRIVQSFEELCSDGSDGADNKSLTKVADKNASWNVYPNPASTTLEITYGSDIKTIVITNIKGEKVKTFTNVNALHMAIDINELPKGMYFINAISNDNTSINRKFIKE